LNDIECARHQPHPREAEESTRTRTLVNKIERWFQEYRSHGWRFDSAYAFAEWYNNRIHRAFDLDCGETTDESLFRELRSENSSGCSLRERKGVSL
jgi:hypothetical protein